MNNAGVSPADASAAGAVENNINNELWQACAGPLVQLPSAGTHVVYFPQGHSEQVAASMKRDVDAQVPSYPNLPSKLLCLLHNITLQADPETDEAYARMTLQPVPSFDKEAILRSDLAMKAHKPHTEFFCKTLTASDTSTHGGFSVPRRAAEKIFPLLDHTMQPPAQELVARDLHDNLWTFRHIYRGQPKRHLLTTGWSLFVSAKRLVAGDSVLFIRDEKQQLLLGIRRANRQPPNLSSSVLSSDSMHIGILAAAAHASANNSPFTVFYNPRASPSEFVIPLAKYFKAVCGNQISLGMRFRMMFETEDSGTRRYMGTVTGISDLDPVRWKNSQWRNLQVGWDESIAGEKRNRVSIWEIEPVTAPFFICPAPSFFQTKRPRIPGIPDNEFSDLDNMFRRTMPWLGGEFGSKDPQAMPGLSLAQWMNMQQSPSQPNYMNFGSANQVSEQTFPLSAQRPSQGMVPQDQLQKVQSLNTLGSIMQAQSQSLSEQRQSVASQSLPMSQDASQILQSQVCLQAQSNNLQQQQSDLNNRNLSTNLHVQQQNVASFDHSNQQMNMSDNQIQLQFLQKLNQQQQSLLTQQTPQMLTTPFQNQQKQIFDTSQANPQETKVTLPQSHATTKTDQNNPRFVLPPQQSGTFTEYSGNMGNVVMRNVGGFQSTVTDDIPSCSTSPSTNNCSSLGHTVMNGKGHQDVRNEFAQIKTSCLENISPRGDFVRDIRHKAEVKPSLNVSKSSNPSLLTQTCHNTIAQVDYLDCSSSATSLPSQNGIQISQHNNNSASFNTHSMIFHGNGIDSEVPGDLRNNNVLANIDNQLGIPMVVPDDPLVAKNMDGSGKDFYTDFSAGGSLLPTYERRNEAQPEPSTSIVSQSFGVPDVGFNSIDSTINEGSFINRGSWAPPQIPRMRTYTKVYKRGAVGRSIDITRYSGYVELKHDLARRFGIEGQLEDGQRIGWKLVYVDHENDVLLVGDDPWDEFVNCVRCIKILSPQEVQQMSLDGDFGNSIMQNQTCSSSDNALK